MNIDELIERANKISNYDDIKEIDIYTRPSTLAQQHWNQFETPPHITLIEDHLLKIDEGNIKKLMVCILVYINIKQMALIS